MEVTAYQIWEVIGVWFTGLATFAAVAFALYLRHSYERRQRPSLTANYDKSSEQNNRFIPSSYAKGIVDPEDDNMPEREELWLRIHIENDSNIMARDVELRFISILREKKSNIDNRSSWWFKVSNLDKTSISIPPKFPQYFDIAYVRNVKGVNKDLTFYLTIVSPDLKPWRAEKERIEKDEWNNRLDIGWEYKLRFALLSSNTDAKYYEMIFKVDLREKDDPPLEKLLGEKALRKRLNVISFKEVAL